MDSRNAAAVAADDGAGCVVGGVDGVAVAVADTASAVRVDDQAAGYVNGVADSILTDRIDWRAFLCPRRETLLLVWVPELSLLRAKRMRLRVSELASVSILKSLLLLLLPPIDCLNLGAIERRRALLLRD